MYSKYLVTPATLRACNFKENHLSQEGPCAPYTESSVWEQSISDFLRSHILGFFALQLKWK